MLALGLIGAGATGAQDPVVGMLSALLAAAAIVWLARGARITAAVIVLPTILYALGPFYAASLGDTLWPHAGIDVYRGSAVFMVIALFAAVALSYSLGLLSRMNDLLPRAVDEMINIAKSTAVTFLSALITVVFAAQSWVVALANGGAAFGGARRTFEAQLWVASNLVGQTTAIAASVLLLTPALVIGRQRVARVALFLILWSPFLLGGGRRIFVYVAIPLMLIVVFRGNRSLKIAALLSFGVGATWFTVAPLFFLGGGDFAAHGEWSISGAPFVAMFSGALRASDIGAVQWPGNLIRILPDALGGNLGTPVADALTRTNLYTAGTSGSPWVDAWTGSWPASIVSFASILIAIQAVILVGARLAPASILFALGSMSILGRSHAPYAITTIIAATCVTLIAFAVARSEARHESTRSRPSHLKSVRSPG